MHYVTKHLDADNHGLNHLGQKFQAQMAFKLTAHTQ